MNTKLIILAVTAVFSVSSVFGFETNCGPETQCYKLFMSYPWKMMEKDGFSKFPSKNCRRSCRRCNWKNAKTEVLDFRMMTAKDYQRGKWPIESETKHTTCGLTVKCKTRGVAIGRAIPVIHPSFRYQCNVIK